MRQKDEVVIRSETFIKSRQWWISSIRKVKNGLKRFIPKRKLSLLKEGALTLLVTNDREMKDLNRKFRKINKPTDVLSFHLKNKDQLTKNYLGDIVISVQTAKKQAQKQKKTIESELLMLLAHAYLHLLGYDHKLQKEAKIMFSLQNKTLKAIR